MRIHFIAIVLLLTGVPRAWAQTTSRPLWQLYEQELRDARYVDLTHVIKPDSPVWKGFGPQKFSPSVDPATGSPYTYAKDGFEANAYQLSTDQLCTQLDPPAHWSPDFPAIDELPATYTLRPLVVISMVEQVQQDPGYQLRLTDILAWESVHGALPQGSVVFLRSDWSKRWDEPGLAAQASFPGVTLEALQYLHLQRHILFHGHEPLDTDTTPTLEGEAWLLRNGYAQAEGVANLDQVPETGALVSIGFSKFAGGTGSYARFVAICPADWRYGIKVGEVPEAPMSRMPRPLHWDESKGMRTRN